MAKNVFISVPLSGRTNMEIWEDLVQAASEYNELHPGEEILYFDNNSCVTDKPHKDGKKPLLYLAEALQTMALCDDVIFAGNWKEAKGCQVERLVYDLYFKES